MQIMFFLYANDILSHMECSTKMFARNTRIRKVISKRVRQLGLAGISCALSGMEQKVVVKV